MAIPRLITRAGWGAEAPVHELVRAPLDRGFAVHWEDAEAPRDHSRCDDVIRSVQAFHTGPARRWSDIAYSFLVCRHGGVYEGRGWGKRTAAQGTDDGNARWYAVCALGNSPDDFSSEQAAGISAVIAEGRARGVGHAIAPHSAFHATECPGDRIRGWVLSGRAAKSTPLRTTPPPTPAHHPAHPGYPAWPGVYLRVGGHGTTVATAQAQLRHRGWPIVVDGVFGPRTQAVVCAFQAEKHLGVDGVIGPRTWQAMFVAPVTR